MVRVGNVPDAEDLTSKIFYNALANINRWHPRPDVPFESWLFRIAHNVVANWYRDNSRRRTESINDSEWPVTIRVKDPGPAEQVVNAEEVAELRQAVAQLPPDRQRLLLLKFSEDLSNASIGLKMGRTEGAVKALLHRTVTGLKEELTRKPNNVIDRLTK